MVPGTGRKSGHGDRYAPGLPDVQERREWDWRERPKEEGGEASTPSLEFGATTGQAPPLAGLSLAGVSSLAS